MDMHGSSSQQLGLLDEFILLLLNEESGFFHQVAGWNLNCAAVGAALAELSLISRIDTDMESLFLIDATETDNPVLNLFLKQIAEYSAKGKDPSKNRTTQYWIERLIADAEPAIDQTLSHLIDLKILKYHDGNFWTLAPRVEIKSQTGEEEGVFDQRLIKERIRQVIFEDEIPHPRDIIIMCLVNACNVFRYIYDLDEAAEERINSVCQMDLIGQAIAKAVESSITNPLLQRSSLAKKIPTVSLLKLITSPNFRTGNIAAALTDLYKQYGSVFKLNFPFMEPMIFIAGPSANHWVNRNGRLYLTSQLYFTDFENVYGARGVLPALDGTDHFRLRRALSTAYSRGRVAGQLNIIYDNIRKAMEGWTVGKAYPARTMCRYMMNRQISALTIGVDSQDIFDDIMVYKERALTTHIMNALPKFMLKTPGMRKRAKSIDVLMARVQSVQTTAQRADRSQILVDDLFDVHGNDPLLIPECNFRFALSAALVASVYGGDALNFAVYSMVSQPDIYERIRKEAQPLFENGDPSHEAFTPEAIDVTQRFIMEVLRMYPIVGLSIRDVINSCVVEGYNLPVGTRLFVGQSATHFMEDLFPDPYKFDIDRYLPERNEHRQVGFAPYGLGPHTCLGKRWVSLQMSINLLMIAYYFQLKVHPDNYKLKINPIPSMKPSNRLKYQVVEQLHELPA